MQVVNGDAVRNSTEANFIELTITGPLANSRTRHKHAEPVWIVIASAITLRNRHAAKLSSPDHERAVDQTALLQVGQQRIDRFVCGTTVSLVIAVQIAVGVPFTVAVNLDETHTAFNQSASHQALGTKRTCVL